MFEQNIFQGPGTGTFASHTFEIIFMLLVAFGLGVWLGYVLWSKFRAEIEQLRMQQITLESAAAASRNEANELKARLADAEAARSAQEARVSSLNLETEQLRQKIAYLENELENAENLSIEPALELAKIESATISLEGTTPPLPSEPLDDDGLPDLENVVSEPTASDTEQPDTETTEARIADAANMPQPDLIPLDELDATLAPPPSPESIVPVAEKTLEMPAEESIIAAVSTGPRDDLKIVEGIGPKIEELLFKAGITTYGQLAATSVQQLQGILDAAGSRFAMHDPGTWSAQALLAANGEWDNLKAYQDFLNAGKRPDK